MILFFIKITISGKYLKNDITAMTVKNIVTALQNPLFVRLYSPFRKIQYFTKIV